MLFHFVNAVIKLFFICLTFVCMYQLDMTKRPQNKP